ncbi:MAG: diversity-generating retroelement protein Avd [Proteobacteria bacterium]|nr:diversity-generating retroelement protein Avd [Pseudomonadota bacterium]
MYRLLLWLIPTLEKFPRSQKFLLGDRLQNEALDVLEHLINATYTRDREPQLRAANLGLEKMRFGVRLAKDLRHLDLKAYEHAARSIDEVGRMVGGWLRSDLASRGDARVGRGHSGDASGSRRAVST